MKKFRVLIVDDSRVSRAMLADMLLNTKFEVCGYAKNSIEAIEKYSDLRPDIVTMDMNLPDGNGIDCSRKILVINPDARIIMVSAMKDASLVRQGRSAGISSFLQKPVKENELLDLMKRICLKEKKDEKAFHESYVKPFSKVFQKSIAELVGKTEKVRIEEDDSQFIQINGIAVIIGLTGQPLGRVFVYMDAEVMKKLSEKILYRTDPDEISEADAVDSIVEQVNIIVGRGASLINEVYRDKEMRITPPGTIIGKGIRIANDKFSAYSLTAKTPWGDLIMHIGFAEGGI